MLWFDQSVTADTLKQIKEHRQDILFTSLVTVACSLSPLVVGWFKDRDTAAKRSRLVDDANKQVLFWKNWYEAITSVNPDCDVAERRKRAEQNIHNASVLVESSSQTDASIQTTLHKLRTFEIKRVGLSGIRKVFLLYKPARPLAWIPRVFFWVYLMCTVLFLSMAISVYRGDTTRSDHVTDLIAVFVVLAICSVILFVLRQVSVYLERPRKLADVEADGVHLTT
ncbi:MAG TPA: hypothetical protein VGN16_24750 [Acidobacteriaceae bacterium]|jgi:hypothetical protein